MRSLPARLRREEDRARPPLIAGVQWVTWKPELGRSRGRRERLCCSTGCLRWKWQHFTDRSRTAPDLNRAHRCICTRVSCPPLAWRLRSSWGRGSSTLISCSDKDLQRNYDTFTRINEIDVDDMLVYPHPIILQCIHITQGRTGSSIASTQRLMTLKKSWSDLTPHFFMLKA